MDSYSEDLPWTAPVGPLPAEGKSLSTPKPDVGVGLKVMSARDFYRAMRSTYTADAVLSMTVLDDLYADSETRLIASPSPGLAEMAFPFLVYEAKPDSSPLLYAENQAAGGVAKCLALQRQVWHPSMASPPLAFAICSQGAFWEVFVCYLDEENDEYVCPILTLTLTLSIYALICYPFQHLVKVGKLLDIQDDLDNLQLQLMLGRIRTWALQTYRPAIIDALTTKYPPHLARLRRAT